MSNSPSHIPIFIHPAIKNLNVRQISKIIATKIIETTALQLQFNSTFCSQLDVADHLNTYQALTYFIDNQFLKYMVLTNLKSLVLMKSMMSSTANLKTK